MGAKRIALIHSVDIAMEPVSEAFHHDWPEAETVNVLDDSLSGDLAAAGELTPGMHKRFASLVRYALDMGADGVLFTCSAFGDAIETARSQTDLPVLKPNEAMFEDALRAGSRIGMIATFEPSVSSMEKEFRAMAAESGSDCTIESICVPEAMELLRYGDAETHNRLIAEAAPELAHCDTVMLAQFSMVRALDAVRAAIDRPVLTSPGSAVAKLKAAIGA